jgi:hypothetical protein
VQRQEDRLARVSLIAAEFDFIVFDTSDLIIQKERASVEIPIRYRHRQTGAELEAKIVNFWTFEEGWPVKLSEYHGFSRIQAFTAQLASLTPAEAHLSGPSRRGQAPSWPDRVLGSPEVHSAIGILAAPTASTPCVARLHLGAKKPCTREPPPHPVLFPSKDCGRTTRECAPS